jgi:hypothetical protein
MWTDGRTDMTKQIVAFCNFPNAFKNDKQLSKLVAERWVRSRVKGRQEDTTGSVGKRQQGAWQATRWRLSASNVADERSIE